MNLLVCFKILQDVDSVMQSDWENASAGGLNISYTQKQIGFYDEAALEMALRLKEQAGAEGSQVQITALTIDPEPQTFFYRNFFAVGIDQVVRVPWGEDLRFRPRQVARLLAEQAREGGFDGILMGQRTSNGDNGQTPQLLAGMLGLPCVTHVTELAWRKEGLLVTHQVDGGVRHGLTAAPMVYAVGNALHPYLRVATLREKLKTAKRQETVADPAAGPQPEKEDAPLLWLRREQRGKSCVFLEGATVAEKVQTLYDNYLGRGIG